MSRSTFLTPYLNCFTSVSLTAFSMSGSKSNDASAASISSSDGRVFGCYGENTVKQSS